jgi:GxxExxY protein
MKIMIYKHSTLTSAIINAFYRVYNQLGYGFLEKVYENALAHELRKRDHHVEQQAPIDVHYDGISVGVYFADLCVDHTVIVEIKVAETLVAAHEAQSLNYLKATRADVGLLLNFGPQPQVKRKIYETARRE